jgi:quinol-cytochrome oxidoreductase complex cytochrome b subunit
MEDNKMSAALWIIIGCLFLTSIGTRFIGRVLALKPYEVWAVIVLIVLIVGINTVPVRELIMNLF